MDVKSIRERHKWYNTRWFRVVAPIYDVVEFILGPLRKKVVQKLKVPKGKILDMACGTGNQSIAFAQEGYSVVGIDLSPHMLKHANKKMLPEYDITFICGDAAETEYSDSTFDASSVSFGLHDMPEEVGVMVLKEMIRTTKLDGQIIIVDYNTPIQTLSQRIGHIIAKLWESRNYDHFRHVGLKHYLDRTRLEPKSIDTYLFDNVQIIECVNKK